MSTDPTTTAALVPWQRDRLAVLLDALDGVTVSDAERRSLEWLSGWEKHTVANPAADPAGAGSRGTQPGVPVVRYPRRPHVVLGDPVCEGCYRDHHGEVAPAAAQ